MIDNNQDSGVAPRAAEMQGSLQEAPLLLNRVVHAAVTSIVVTDPHLPDNPIVYHNPAFERFSGYSLEEIDGHNCRFLKGRETDRADVPAKADVPDRVVFLIHESASL